MNNTDLSIFENTINYKFNNIDLLKKAFTHSSYANEKHIESMIIMNVSNFWAMLFLSLL